MNKCFQWEIKMFNKLTSKLIAKFGNYKVMDNYGTEINCLTYRGALKWVAYCGKQVVIYNNRTGAVLAARYQGN